MRKKSNKRFKISSGTQRRSASLHSFTPTPPNHLYGDDVFEGKKQQALAQFTFRRVRKAAANGGYTSLIMSVRPSVRPLFCPHGNMRPTQVEFS
jgi:hypothetical protein